MQLYQDNRADREFEMQDWEIARFFWLSPWGDGEYSEWPLERRVRAFMTAAVDDGGLAVTWDDEDGFEEVMRMIRASYTIP